FFFFSSRRRHTRCLSDWSSDVCSSDLVLGWVRQQACKEALIPATVTHGSLYTMEGDLQRDSRPSYKTIQASFLTLKSATEEETRSEERRVGKEGRYQITTEQ